MPRSANATAAVQHDAGHHGETNGAGVRGKVAPLLFICVLPAPDRVRAGAAHDRVTASRKASPHGVAFTPARTAPYDLADLQIDVAEVEQDRSERGSAATITESVLLCMVRTLAHERACLAGLFLLKPGVCETAGANGSGVHIGAALTQPVQDLAIAGWQRRLKPFGLKRPGTVDYGIHQADSSAGRQVS